MDLDEMKDKWEHMSEELEQQKLLTDKLIMELTTEKYKRKIKGIYSAETFGAIVCGLAILFILINLNSLDTWYLQVLAFIAILFFVIMPYGSFKAMKGLYEAGNASTPIKENLEKFARAKKHFVLLQKVSFYLSFFMFFITLIVVAKIINGIDLIQKQPDVLLFAVPVGLLFMGLFSFVVFSKYNKSMDEAEQLLKDLN